MGDIMKISLKIQGVRGKVIWVCLVLFSFLGACAAGYILRGEALNNGVGMCTICGLLIYAGMRLFFQKEVCTIPVLDLVFGCLAALALCIGRTVYDRHSLEIIGEHPFFALAVWLGAILLITVFFSCIRILQPFCTRWFREKKTGKWAHLLDEKKERIRWAVAGGILVVVYLLCYLSYYPGIFGYDAINQTYQVLEIIDWNNHHTVIHTFLWKLCLAAGGQVPEQGMMIYTFAQLLLVVGCYLYTIHWMRRRKYPRVLITITYLYYLLVPTLHVFSIIMTKDILFSCCLLNYILSVADLHGTKSRSSFIRCCLWGSLAALLRNNMMMAAMVMLLVAVCIRKWDEGRMVWKQFLVVAMIGLAVLKGVYPAIGVVQDDSVNESLSVPFSQLAYVYHNSKETLSEGEIRQIESYLPSVGYYNPRFADTIKYDFNRDLYQQSSSKFWSLYLDIGLHHVEDYLTAFFDLNIPYWYPLAAFPDPYSGREYIETGIAEMDDLPLTLDSKLPVLHDYYESFTDFENTFMRIPVCYLYFSLSFPALSLFVGAYLAILNRRKGALYLYLILGLFLATYLMGPVSNFRYIYVFYLAFPVYFFEFTREPEKERLWTK